MQGQRLLTSVPPLDAQGYFVRVCREMRDAWKIFAQSSVDSPFVSKKDLEKMRREWVEGSITWQAKVEGKIPEASSSEMLITLQQIEEAQKRYTLAEEDYSTTIPGLGVDVARFGDDRTSRCCIQGFRVKFLAETSKKDTMDTVGRVRSDLDRLGNASKGKWDPKVIPVAVDDTGLGGGVTDRLRELEYNVTGINFGAKARNPMYRNKRVEMWWNASEAMDKLELPLDDDHKGAGGRLAAELTWPKVKYTSTGRDLEPKDSIKKRLGPIPGHG